MKEPEKLGRYDLVRLLGKGAMGTVYEARDPNLDRKVAIKTIRFENLFGEAATEYEARFRTEARSAARLQHANIVSVYDSDRDGDIAFLVMEFVQGEDLKHHLDSGMRYSISQSLRMMADLLSALDYAHQQNIVHRDIKPANLLIEADGRLKLTDFGVARIQDSAESTRTKGSMVGTLKYMSPEQVQGQPVDSRADLFAAGVILYQLLVGKAPFGGDNEFAIIQQIVGQAPPLPSKVNGLIPSVFDEILARALAKSRDMRFSSAAEFLRALRDAGGSAIDEGKFVTALSPNRISGLETKTNNLLPAGPVSPVNNSRERNSLNDWCTKCGHENSHDAKFCGNCGAPLGKRCVSCGTLNLPNSKFCANCGTGFGIRSQTDRSGSSQKISSTRAQGAERRQITVMFCDLVGSTSLSHDLDPEDLRSAVHAYQEMASEAITFYDGHIAQYLGDGILVYFGYPTAHEDDARRAVSTGLRIVEALPDLNKRLRQDTGLGDIRLQVRVGIHTGLVVAGDVGSGGRRDQLAIGETPNIAAHMQALAEPNTVILTKTTYRLVEKHYELVALGPRVVKGLAQPMRAYQARAELPTQITFSPIGPSSNELMPMIGRERHSDTLRARWQHVEQGIGHVALLSGDAGIGKSRLVRDLVEHVMTRVNSTFEVRFSPYHQQSPFHAVADLILQLLGLGKESSQPDRLSRLESLLRQHDIAVAEGLPALGSLIGLSSVDMPTTVSTSPEERRRVLIESVLQILVGTAATSPVLLVFEDLHWADPSTIELIGLLVDQVPTSRILVLLSARPAFVPPWPSRSHVSQLQVEPFTQAQTEALVKQLTGGKTLPQELLKQIVTKTDGVPLFAEELIKYVVESGLLRESAEGYELVGTLPAMAIPATLQDSLMARLDRLAHLKSLVQLAATLGREFSYVLLRAVTAVDDVTLRQQLAGLVEAELIYQRGLPPKATYVFKHALIQDTAYQSLLKATRRQYHRHIAEVMAERFPEMAESHPELLAHHCTFAGLTVEAIDCWSRAGERALQRSAYLEAISHHSQALLLVADLPDVIARKKQELVLLVALAPSLDATKGISSPEAHRAYERAWDLCQELGDSTLAFGVLMGLRRYYFVHGDLGQAHSVAEQLLNIAEKNDNSTQKVETHLAFGVIALWRGDARAGLEHLLRGIGLTDVGQRTHQANSQLAKMSSPVVSCLSYGSWASWITGAPEQALDLSRLALEHARLLGHPISLALALDFAAALHEFRREAVEALSLAEEGIALCKKHEFRFWLSLLMIRRGWALSYLGQPTEGLSEFGVGLKLWAQSGAGLARPFLLALQAEVLMRAGMFREALDSLHDGLRDSEARGERFYESESRRLIGEVLVSLENANEAAPSFELALGIARSQGAKAFELRASSSMARSLLASQNPSAARSLLTRACSDFTGAVATPDLLEARALLATIGPAKSRIAEDR